MIIDRTTRIVELACIVKICSADSTIFSKAKPIEVNYFRDRFRFRNVIN